MSESNSERNSCSLSADLPLSLEECAQVFDEQEFTQQLHLALLVSQPLKQPHELTEIPEVESNFENETVLIRRDSMNDELFSPFDKRLTHFSHSGFQTPNPLPNSTPSILEQKVFDFNPDSLPLSQHSPKKPLF